MKIAESQLRNIISESIQSILFESLELAKNVPPQIQKQYIAKMIKEYPDLDPAGFFYVGNNLKHNGKKKPYVPKEKISKPEGMGDKEYIEKIVKPNNQEFAKSENSLYSDEQFRPIVNSGRYFRGEADYSKSYEISNYGRLRVIDYNDASKCRIVNGYPAPTSKAMQFNLNGDNHTCPPVHSMVADAWLEPKDPHLFAVKHKDGDWHNNYVGNLMWVPRKNRRDNLSVKLK